LIRCIAICATVIVGVFGADVRGQGASPVRVLHPSGAMGDLFGSTVAIDGDTCIAGAPLDDVGGNTDQGSAHVYRRTVTGWALEATLTASDGAATDYFGDCVGISGDTVVVGAHFADISGKGNQGAAYVFVRDGGSWTQQAKLTASDGSADDWFGRSIAVCGDTVIVGEYFDTNGTKQYQGAAYVFTRSGTAWTQQAKLTATDGLAGDYFGRSVAMSGNSAIIGALRDDSAAGDADVGSAYIFTRSGTSWSQQARLIAADGSPGDEFGVSVDIDGSTAIVGSHLDDVGFNVNQGSAYVFTRAGTVWRQQARLNANGASKLDYFGISVSVDGGTAMVGAHADDVASIADQGSAIVFSRSGDTWSQRVQLNSVDGASGDVFGYCVALSGSTAVVGAWGDDVGTNANQGSAWILEIPIPSPCVADLDNDGRVDDADFQLFVVAYDALDCDDPLMPKGCSADFNGDNVVDDDDFQIFVAAYDELLCP
jgi:hypothetical protein